MKRSLQLSLLSVSRRSFLGLGAVVAALVACQSAALAVTAVDVYQDMESGNNGDVLTAALMNASTHPTGTPWGASSGTLWVSTKYHMDLPGPVIVGGVTYNGTGGSRTWVNNNNNNMNYVEYSTWGTFHSRMTVACYYTTETTIRNTTDYDVIMLYAQGGMYSVMQNTNEDGAGPYFRCHSKDSANNVTVSDNIKVTTGKTYWVNMKYDGPGYLTSFAVFDPANSYAQVGSTVTAVSGSDVMYDARFGRVDAHSNMPSDTTQSWWGNILIDWTNAAFPLIPTSSGTDTTPPSAPGSVRDGTGSDIAYTTSTTQLSANWDASSDAQSGISGYQYAIGTSAGGTQTVNWTSLGNVTTVTKTGLSLTNGQTYYFSVKAINGVGLTGNATNSNGQTVDSTAPSAPPTVRDGTGADISTTSSNTQLSANWDASTDIESGISGYQYAIGTSAGGTQTVNWTSLGNVTTVTKTGLSLANGQTYYFGVRAINGAGATGSATNSNGQTVQTTDSTPPSAPPNVRDGLGADISTTNSTTQLSANWDASTDNESGISGYQYAIGTTAGGTQTVNWTSPGNVTTVTKTGLTLTVGQTYFFSVRAVNGAGLTGSATNSNGQTIVSGGSSATPVDVYQDMESGNNGDVLTATIMNASSHPSGTAWSAPSGSLWVSTSKHSDLPGPVVVGGVTYNGTGGTRAWVYNNNNASNYVTYGGTARPKLTVACYYTTNTTIRNTTTYGTIGMSGLAGIWTMMINENGDSAGPYLRLSSKDSSGAVVGSPDIKITAGKTYWVNLKYDGAAYASSLAVFDPASSFAQVGSTATVGSGSDSMFSIKFGRVDNNGNLTAETTQSWFDQILIDWTNAAFPLIPSSSGTDSTPPSAPPAVRDGTGADISTTSSTTQLSANWDASTDNESGISGYQYAIGTSAGGTQTVNWTSLGNVTTVTKTGLTLTNGQTYYFSVKAVDGAGLTGSATNSNGQTVQTTDVTPPSAPANVRDGTGADISTTSSTTQLSANWDAATDAESGISGYQYAIGTTAGGTQIVNWTSLGNVTTVTKTGLTLTVGQTYFFSVQAVNGAGLTGSATNSNGQTVVSSAVTYFSDNFESWTVHGGAWSSVSGETSTQTLNTSTDYARAGTKSLKLTDTDTTNTYGACLVENFSPTISGNIYVRFYVYLPTGYTSANAGGASRRLLRVWCQSNRGQMSLYSGATPLMEEVGAWGASLASSALSENAWHCIEMYMATPSASTAMQYWIDGTSAGTLNGSYSGSSSYNRMEFGDVCVGSGTNDTGTFYLDEVIVSNTYNGLLP